MQDGHEIPTAEIAGGVPTIDYAGARPLDHGPRSPSAARTVLAITVAAPGFGLLILLLFRYTHWQIFPPLGVLWLMGGGLLTLICLIICAVQAMQTRPGENDRKIRKLYAAGIVVALLACPLAVLCCYAGAAEMDNPYFCLKIVNATDRPIENVSVLFDEGAIDSGPLQPHASTRTWRYHYHHRPGTLQMVVAAGGQTAHRTDQIFCDNNRLLREDIEVRVEPIELPPTPGERLQRNAPDNR